VDAYGYGKVAVRVKKRDKTLSWKKKGVTISVRKLKGKNKSKI